MGRLKIIICRVDDEENPEQMTELQRIDVPEVKLEDMKPHTGLDTLESGVLKVGQEVMRQLLQVEWAETETRLIQEYQARFSPSKRRSRRS